MIFHFIANATTTVAEFTGIAAAAALLSRFRRPGALHRRPDRRLRRMVPRPTRLLPVVERVLLVLTLVYVPTRSAFMAAPALGPGDPPDIRPTVRPSTAFILIFISVVGTTITPWMAFFQQSNVADKGLHPSDLTYERVDTGSVSS